MSINREKKEVLVGELRERLNSAQAVVIAEYPGTSVASFTAFRKLARESGVYVRVIKNRLAKLAVQETPYESLAEKLVGPLVYGIGDDSVKVAKLFKQFNKDNESVKINSGAVPMKLLSAKEIEALASLPGREELLASLVGTMQAPLIKFLRTANEVPGSLVRVLAALRDAKA